MSDDRHSHEPSLGHSFVIGLLEVDLHLPVCRSLKTKRGILARTMNHLRTHFPLVVAEVGDHDVWGRAGLAAVTLSGEASVIERVLNDAVEWIETSREVELVHHQITLL